jgi:hypothetical protein
MHGRRPDGEDLPVHTPPTCEVPVPLFDRIRAFLASPKGRRLTDQGRRYASDPRNQQRARDLAARWRRRR